MKRLGRFTEVKHVNEMLRELELGPRAQALIAKGQINAALPLLNEALGFNPKSTTLKETRAQVLLELKRPDEAIKDYSDLIKAHPKSISAYSMRGNAYVQIEHYDLAIRDFSEAIKIAEPETKKLIEEQTKNEFLPEVVF